MKAKWFPLIGVLILFSCSKSDEQEQISLERINLMSANDVNIPDKITFGKHVILETTDESLFGQIDKMLIKGNKIFMLDRRVTQSILMFDKDGQFQRKWTVGKGPDQFSSADDFYVDDNADTLTVLSAYRKKLLYYDTHTGELVKEKEAPEGARRFTVDNDRFIYEMNPEYGYHLSFENRERDLDKQVKLPVYNSKVIPLMNGFHHHDSTITRLFSSDTIIYEVSEGIAKPKYTLQFGKAPAVLNDSSLLISGNSKVTMLKHWIVKEHIILTSVLDGKSFLVIYDSSNGETYSSISNGGVISGDELILSYVRRIIGTVNDHLVVSLDAHEVSQIKAVLKFIGDDTLSEKTKANLNKLVEISSQVKNTDNPVLLFLYID